MPKAPSDQEIADLARQAGLDLPPEYLAELVDAYGHVRPMLDRLLMPRPHGDEPAHVFAPSSFGPSKSSA